MLLKYKWILDKMELCKAYKNIHSNIQCNNKIKYGCFCGKHKNSIKQICIPSISSISSNSKLVKYNLYKIVSQSAIYNNFLQQRTQYIHYSQSSQHIELIEYIENNKLDYYPTSRVLASLGYYKLINNTLSTLLPKTKSIAIPKYILVSTHMNKLISMFETLITAHINIKQIIKIQIWMRCKIKQIHYNIIRLRGTAYYNRSLCVNDTDFVSLDDIQNKSDIPDNKFISFIDKDNSNYIYGFHIDNIFELIVKTDDNYYEQFIKQHSQYPHPQQQQYPQFNLCYKKIIKMLYKHYNKITIYNPYTRNILTSTTKLNVITLYILELELTGIKKSKEHKDTINEGNKLHNNILDTHTETHTDTYIDMHTIPQLDIKIIVRNKCFTIFQKIDLLGYYTDILWLLDEQPIKLKLFYKKLANIWNYEFGLDSITQYNISGTLNLFNNINEIVNARYNKYILLDKILDTINTLVDTGINDGYKNTGCILVLYALAFINHRCILANPWLS